MPTSLRESQLVAGIFIIFLPSITVAQVGREVDEADYDRARSYLAANLSSLVFLREVEPHWLGEDARFWYEVSTPRGRRFRIVDPESRDSRNLFDSDRLLAALRQTTGEKLEELPIESVDVEADLGGLEFEWMKSVWVCDLRRYDCRKDRPVEDHSDQLLSRNGRWAVQLEGNDLAVIDRRSGTPRRLTDDGESHYGFGTRSEGRLSTVFEMRADRPVAPVGIISPDSRWLLTHRLDERRIPELHLMQSVPDDGRARPRLFSFRYSLPGDSAVPVAELLAFDLESLERTDFATAPLLAMYPTLRVGMAWWHAGRVYWIREHRGNGRLDLQVGDPATGEVRTIIRERGETFVEPAPNRYPPLVRVIGDGSEVIWYSERDGWAHFYLYDVRTGELKNRITSGEWAVRELIHVNEDRRVLYFTAGGREAGRDPYYRHLYRVGLDGSDLRLLTAEDADHEVTASPDGRYFIDVYSRVDMPPRSVVRSSAGDVVMELEIGDVERLLARGWRWPHRFSVKARDGVTEIYGILVLPSTFDSTRAYPVIDEIYQGPQVTHVPKSFSVNGIAMAQSIAELGFVVMMLDGMGTPHRSKAFHDVAYGNLGDLGLEDHVGALRQLTLRLPFLDLDRVGIYGHSGGGYAAARAVLRYPDFFDAAMAISGNHDQRSYIARWGERYQGVPPEANYVGQANRELAGNLEGALMLVHGELDDNVHPSNTIALADALIRADKDFDFMLVPNAGHGIFTHPYVVRRRWAFFVEHLLGLEPPRHSERRNRSSRLEPRLRYTRSRTRYNQQP